MFFLSVSDHLSIGCFLAFFTYFGYSSSKSFSGTNIDLIFLGLFIYGYSKKEGKGSFVELKVRKKREKKSSIDPESSSENWKTKPIHNISDFLLFMASKEAIQFCPLPFRLSDLGPCKLSWSNPSYSCWGLTQMWVFWSTYNDEQQHVNLQLGRATGDIFTGDAVTKEKIKYILQRPRLFDLHKYLVQFWGLVKIGDKMYLTTCDQPFALSYYNYKEGMEGLCGYRKKCLNYLIPVPEISFQEEQHGPPGRVFYSGLPEYVEDIQHYSHTEYPLYDSAVNCVQGYWALPVRIPPANSPVGVLEITSSACWVNDRYFVKVLKDIGLCEQNEFDPVSCSLYLRANSCQKKEITRINKVLKVACEAHRLSLAQTWMLNSAKTVTAVGRASFSEDRLIGFTVAYPKCLCSVGQGVVGKAFSSKRACYCRDVKQLSIKEYPMVPSARKYGLSGCFAVCLQSSCSNNCTYTLEFFLPSNETNNGDPRTLLCMLMLTLKKQLKGSFKIASGQELGQKLFVEVIKVSSDDTLDSFEICHTSGSESAFGAAEVHSGSGGMMPPDSSCHQVNAVNISINDVHEQKIGIVGSLPALKAVQNIVSITYQQPNAELDATNRDIDGVSLEQSSNDATALRNQGPSYTLDRDEVSLVHSGRKQGSSYTFDRHDGVSLEQSGRKQASSYILNRDDVVSLEQSGNDATALRKQGSSYRDGVSLEKSGNDATALRKQGSSYTLKSERGITREILEKNSTMKLGDAANHLGVSRSTLKRICRDYDIHRWPPHKARKNNQAFPQEKVAQVFVENNEGQSRLDATRQQEHGSITVKATYGDDIIKFQLTFSARKMDLEEKVVQRLNLLVGSFKIKYLDEDNEWILVTCDEDLSTILSTLRLMGRTTLKMWIQ